MTTRTYGGGVVASAAVGDTISIGGVWLRVMDCPSCGVVYAMPDRVVEEHRRNGASHHCPNGHSLSWRKTEADRLREQLQKVEVEAATRSAQLDQERAAHAATKGQLTKARKRIGKGVCPCCNRHFANVERHMASQHPDFATQDKE